MQVLTPAGCPVTVADGWNGEVTGAGAYTGVVGDGAGEAAGAICPARDPQIPQNFSEGERGLPHELQTDCATGWTAGCGGCGGDATGAGAGGATVVGTERVWASSSWDAPQIRQNFAFGATGFPHSGQNGILITTEWLNVVHKEHSISTGQQPE